MYLLDDADALADSKWKVVAWVYDSGLQEVKRVEFEGEGSIKALLSLGTLSLEFEETDSTPLLIVVQVVKDGLVADRTFYFTNFEAEKGCLFTLPQTELEMSVKGNTVTVKNVGELPAVAVTVARPGHLDTFTVSDNYFWLGAGETWMVEVDATDGLTVSAWNAKA